MKAKFDLIQYFREEFKRGITSPISGMYNKADGSERLFEGVLNSEIGVNDPESGIRHSLETFEENQLIPYYDATADAWRQFKLIRLRRFTINNVEFEITGN